MSARPLLIALLIALPLHAAYASEADDEPAGEEPEDPGDVSPLLADDAALPPNAPVLLLTDSAETADKLVARGMALAQGATQHALKPQPTSPPTALIPLNADLVVDLYERRGHASLLVKLWPETPLTPGKARLLQTDAAEDGLDVPTRLLPYVATWSVAAAPDTAPPRWLKAPSLAPSPARPGPGAQARQRVLLPIKPEATPSFIQLDIKPARGPLKTYLLLHQPDEADPDHRCDTFLALNDPAWLNQQLTLSFTFIDMAGNRAPAPGKPLRVKAAASTALTLSDLPLALCVGKAP
jgi:hypothetical protein